MQGGFHLKHHTRQENNFLGLLFAKTCFISFDLREPQLDLSLLQTSVERQKPTCSVTAPAQDIHLVLLALRASHNFVAFLPELHLQTVWKNLFSNSFFKSSQVKIHYSFHHHTEDCLNKHGPRRNIQNICAIAPFLIKICYFSCLDLK